MGRRTVSLTPTESERLRMVWSAVALGEPIAPSDDVLLTTLNEQRFPGALLPRATAAGRVYYAVASTQREWRELRALVLAYVGRTTSDFDGETSPMNPHDPAESLLETPEIVAVGRFSGAGSKLHEAATASGLTTLVTQVTGAPLAVHRWSTPLSVQLQQLDEALAADDQQLSAAALRQLEDDPRLDALNLAYLRTHVSASFREWPSMIAGTDFSRLLRSRRPVSVTRELADALFFGRVVGRRLGSPEEIRLMLNESVAATTFRDAIDLVVGDEPPLNHFPSLMLGMARGLALGNLDKRTLVAAERFALEADPASRDTWSDLLSLGRAAAASPSPVAAMPSLSTLLTDPPTLAKARAVLFRVAEFERVADYPLVLSYIERLTQAERSELEMSFAAAAVLRQIRALTYKGLVVTDWSSWLRALPEITAEQVRASAQQLAAGFAVDDAFPDAESIKAMAGLVLKVPDAAGEQLRCGLPILVEWLDGADEMARPRLRDLYVALFDRLLGDDVVTRSKVELLVKLLDALLSIGVDPVLCTRLLQDIQDQLGVLVSARTLDPVVDLIEATVLSPCTCPDARVALWAQVVGELQQWGGKAEPAHREVLEDIGVVLGQSGFESWFANARGVRDAEQTTVPRRSLRVLLYTLRPGVGDRVAELLRRAAPHIKLTVSNALAAEGQLREQARGADIVVICWGSAKHAATDAIKRVVEPSRIRYSSGNGSSSVMREISEAARLAA